MSGGSKNDQGKPRLGLLATKWLWGVARVLTFGAKKYAAHNWRKGFDYSRLYDAAQRHLSDWNDGNDFDIDPNCQACKEKNCLQHSGENHLLNASCMLMFLYELQLSRPDLDDRYKPEQKEPDQGLEHHEVQVSSSEWEFKSYAISKCPKCGELNSGLTPDWKHFICHKCGVTNIR